MPSFPEHHQLPEPTQTQVYHVGDTIQPSHPLLSPSPPGFRYAQINFQASMVVQTVKNLPAMHKTRDPSLGQEDPLEWLPTPVFLPGQSYGQRSLAGYSPWGH